MKRIHSFYKLFLREPIWFRMVVGISLLTSIVLSSSVFPLGGYSESVSKLAAAIFFGAFGVNMWRNLRISLLFSALGVLCLYTSWNTLP